MRPFASLAATQRLYIALVAVQHHGPQPLFHAPSTNLRCSCTFSLQPARLRAARPPASLRAPAHPKLSCSLFFPCSLRGYAQRDPLVEYKLEGYNLFVEMMAQVRQLVQQRSLELNTETTATAICMRMLLVLLLQV